MNNHMIFDSKTMTDSTRGAGNVYHFGVHEFTLVFSRVGGAQCFVLLYFVDHWLSLFIFLAIVMSMLL